MDCPSLVIQNPLMQILKPYSLWFCVLLAEGLPLFGAVTRSSGDYSVTAESLDAAGIRTTRADYTQDGGVVGVVGSAESTDYHITSAFSAQLPNAPVSGLDTLSRSRGLSAKVRLSALLENDTDPDGGSLTIESVDSLSEHGGSVYFEDPWVIYEPQDGFNSTDTFSYVIRNSDGETSVASVTSVVVPPGSVPTRNSVALLPQGMNGLLVRFVGVPGFNYVIQWKAQLMDPEWINLSTTAATANGLFEALDTSGETRFYRAVSQ